MSITIGLFSTTSSAVFMVELNSRSVKSTLVSAWPRINAMAFASKRIFSAFNTAPVIGTAKCASKVSGVFAPINETVSPLPIPCFINAEASKQQRSYVCFQVYRVSPWMIDVLSGYTLAQRSIKLRGVRWAKFAGFLSKPCS